MTITAKAALFLFVICAGSMMAGADRAAAAVKLEVQTIALEEIRPGMKGYGLTVFSGSRVDTFGVEVVGIQKGIRAAGSLLIVEVSGHDLEISSIAQGMSGSPVFIDGRLAGALAFGWSGALRPLAGITPAAEILALPTDPVDLPSSSNSRLGLNMESLIRTEGFFGALTFELLDTHPDPDRFTANAAPELSGGWPEPLSLLSELMSGVKNADAGLDPEPSAWLYRPVGETGLASGDNRQPGRPLEPGSACAIPLIMGDAQLGALGTVTWVENDQVFMMGHPFMQRGPVHLPLATADVLTIFPSRQMSFKLGSVGRVVGSVHHDLRAGLAGRLGEGPELVPVRVSIARDGQQPDTAYDFEVVQDRLMTPTLVFWSLYNALLVEGDDASRQTVSYRLESRWEGPDRLSNTPLVVSGITAGPGGVASLAADWMAPFSLLLNNPFDDVRLVEVKAEFQVHRPSNGAVIQGISGPSVLPEPGSVVPIYVDLAVEGGTKRTIAIDVELPRDLEPGPYRLVAASAADLFALEATRAPGRFQVTSLDGMLGILRTPRSAGTLVVALFAPGRATILQGHEMPDLPASVSRVMRSGNLQVRRSLADRVVDSELETPWVLKGHAVRSLKLASPSAPPKQERRP